MGAIEDIYADLDADVSEEEFREAVEQKVEQMGGLADEETAAMLIAHELADQQVNGIADVEPGMEEVKFLGKVVSIGELREFERDDEDEPGRVVNVEVADETGAVRVAFWDDMARAAVDELEAGQVLRIKGRPRDGYNGVEVSADQVEPDDDAEIDVDLTDTYRIGDLSIGLSDVDLRARVLSVDSTARTFDRDDGSEGRVANMVIGDETGRVRVTLWDDRTDLLSAFEPGDSVEVVDGYVRDRDGDLELHVGRRGTVETIDEDVSYVPDATDIDDLEIGETVDIAGVVRSADPKRTFDRDDGSEGQVRNIRVQDKTGDVRVALWGEQADVEVTPGDEVQLADVEIREGWQDDLEASAGWRSTVSIVESGSDGAADTSEAVAASSSSSTASGGGIEDAGGGESDRGSGGEADLSAFGSADGRADDPDGVGETGTEADRDEASGTGADGPAGDAEDEYVEFTGVVVQAGDPVVLDDGEETVSVETDADVQLGQEITVRGPLREGRVRADDVDAAPS